MIRIRQCRCAVPHCRKWVVLRPEGSVYSYAPTLRKALQDSARIERIIKEQIACAALN